MRRVFFASLSVAMLARHLRLRVSGQDERHQASAGVFDCQL